MAFTVGGRHAWRSVLAAGRRRQAHTAEDAHGRAGQGRRDAVPARASTRSAKAIERGHDGRHRLRLRRAPTSRAAGTSARNALEIHHDLEPRRRRRRSGVRCTPKQRAARTSIAADEAEPAPAATATILAVDRASGQADRRRRLRHHVRRERRLRDRGHRLPSTPQGSLEPLARHGPRRRRERRRLRRCPAASGATTSASASRWSRASTPTRRSSRRRR